MPEQAKTYTQMRNEFYEKYQKKILPRVRMYEEERKVRLFFAVLSSSILAIIGLYFVFIIFSQGLTGEPLEGALKAAALFFWLSWSAWYFIKKNFENSIKRNIMPFVCSCFEKLKWYEGEYGNDNIFVKSCAIPSYTDSRYDDVFIGSYKDVKMDIVEAEYTKGHGRNKTTVFEGVIVKLSMNKDFKGHTVIKADSIFHTSPSSALRHTTLEDVVFESKYDVFTDDEVEARYLITPSFMERMNNVKMAFEATGITCAFYRNKLILTIPTCRDLFSLCSLVKPIDDTRQYFQMYEEIISIIKLIDYFKLDQKIGL